MSSKLNELYKEFSEQLINISIFKSPKRIEKHRDKIINELCLLHTIAPGCQRVATAYKECKRIDKEIKRAIKSQNR